MPSPAAWKVVGRPTACCVNTEVDEKNIQEEVYSL